MSGIHIQLALPKIRVFDNYMKDATTVIIPNELKQEFTNLINRGLNCFPDAHPELKILGDLLTLGSAQQDYYHQRSDL